VDIKDLDKIDKISRIPRESWYSVGSASYLWFMDSSLSGKVEKIPNVEGH